MGTSIIYITTIIIIITINLNKQLNNRDMGTTNAEEPVAQLLFTLTTGIPVMPTSYKARWPQVESPYTYAATA